MSPVSSLLALLFDSDTCPSSSSLPHERGKRAVIWLWHSERVTDLCKDAIQGQISSLLVKEPVILTVISQYTHELVPREPKICQVCCWAPEWVRQRDIETRDDAPSIRMWLSLGVTVRPDMDFAHIEKMKYGRAMWARIVSSYPKVEFRNVRKSKNGEWKEDERSGAFAYIILNEKIRAEVEASIRTSLDVVDGWRILNIHSSFQRKRN